MSSTSRGYNRHKNDYYVTPKNKIEQFLINFTHFEKLKNLDKIVWLDPCAGGHKNTNPPYTEVIKKLYNPEKVYSLDIRQDSNADMKGIDYLQFDTGFISPDIIITNPPFNIAQDIIEKSISDISEIGYVIMLLRLNFFGSKSRENFFKKYLPKSCYVHSRRICFTGDGKTDSIEYAHFVWQKTNTKKYTELYHLSG